MFRVRLINKVIGPSNGIFPVCGKSTKFYGNASYVPEHGGPVLDMSLEDYERDKFDIIGNMASRQQWVPQFYQVEPSVATGPELTFDENGNVVEPAAPPASDYTVLKPCSNAANHVMGVTCQVCNTTLTATVNGIVIGTPAELIVHPGRAKLLQFNELRKRAKAAGVWMQGMKLVDVEKALSAVAD